MTTLVKLTLGAATAAVAAAFALLLYGALTFVEERVESGTAYGLTIGDTSEAVYRKVSRMRERGEISQILRGHGSAAVPLDERSLDSALGDASWTLVYDPTWWNDTATLYFEDGSLERIYRFRLCCELP